VPLSLLKGNFAIFYMLAKYVPGDIKYIFKKFYRHISTNNDISYQSVVSPDIMLLQFISCDYGLISVIVLT
jgi:hypothetical protein